MNEWNLPIIVSIIYWTGFWVTYSHNTPKDGSWRGWTVAGIKSMFWVIFLPIDVFKWNKKIKNKIVKEEGKCTE